MKPIDLFKRTLLSDGIPIIPPPSEHTLKVAGVYEDSMTRDWAMQLCGRAIRVAGEDHVHNNYYDVKSLSDPAVLAEAVSAAVAADVIVVAVYSANQLPAEIDRWIKAWVPFRVSRAGALVAAVGLVEPAQSQASTIGYLQSVADLAHLDFIPQAHKGAASSPAPPASSIERLGERTNTPPGTPAEIYGQRFDAYTDWKEDE